MNTERSKGAEPSFLLVLLIIFCVLGRRHAEHVRKMLAERGQVIEAHALGYLRDRETGFHQQECGLRHADVANQFHSRQVSVLLQFAVERSLTHVEFSGQHLDIELRIAGMALDARQHLLHELTFGAFGFLCRYGRSM